MRYVNNRRPFLAKIREWVDTCTPYSVLCAVGSKNALCLIIHIMFECVVFPSKFISKLAVSLCLRSNFLSLFNFNKISLLLSDVENISLGETLVLQF